ncbi:zinc finger and BTB domain-containing protein 8A, partial [Columba guinea]
NSKETSQPTTASFQAFSPDTFTVILDFVYSGKLSLTGQNVIEVMSAASYLQMTDVISVCKTFIKSSLDISEKEKDRYFSLSDKDVNSNGVDRSCVYSAGWRAESSSPPSHLSPDQGTCMMGGNAWNNLSYYPPSQRTAQQQLSKHEQRQDSSKRSRHLGPQQPADIPSYKSSKLEDRAAEPAGHSAQPEEQGQIEPEVESSCVGYQYGQGADVTPRNQQERESPHSSGKAKSSKGEEPYRSMPFIMGVTGSWAEVAEALREFPPDGDQDSQWHYREDDRSDVEIVEDDSADRDIQQVDDSEGEAEEKEVSPNIW